MTPINELLTNFVMANRPKERAPMQSYLPRFDAEFATKLTKRAATFRLMFELLEKKAGLIQIMETGCVRELGCWDGDGCSTLVFDDYVKYRMSGLISIDNNPESIQLVNANTSKHTRAVCADSVEALAEFNPLIPIDLLYLDSFDFDPENPHPSSLHHLKELAAAQKNLRPGSIICVDDNHPDGTGKGAYVRDYLHNLGIEPIADAYQVVWVWR